MEIINYFVFSDRQVPWSNERQNWYHLVNILKSSVEPTRRNILISLPNTRKVQCRVLYNYAITLIPYCLKDRYSKNNRRQIPTLWYTCRGDIIRPETRHAIGMKPWHRKGSPKPRSKHMLPTSKFESLY